MFQVSLCWNRCNYTCAPKNEHFLVLLVLKLREVVNTELQPIAVSLVPACVPDLVISEWETVYCESFRCLPSMHCEKWGTSSCIWNTECGSLGSIAPSEEEGDVATMERMRQWLGRQEARITFQGVWRAAVVPPCRNDCKCIQQVWYVQQCGVVAVLGTHCRYAIKREENMSGIKSSSKGLICL